MITPTGGGRIRGSQQGDVGFIKGKPIRPPFNSLRSEVRHNVMPQYHGAARKKLIAHRDDLRAAKGAIDEMSKLQVNANMIQYKKDITPIKPPLTDVSQISHLGEDKIRQIMLEPPIGNRVLTYIYERDKYRVPPYHEWRHISIKEALTTGVPVKGYEKPSPITGSMGTYFAMLKNLSTASDTQQSIKVPLDWGGALELNFRNQYNPGGPLGEIIHALERLNSAAIWPETHVMDWGKLIQSLKDIRQALEKLLNEEPRIRDQDTRKKVEGVIKRINDTFNIKFPGTNDKVTETDAVKIWLLDQQHAGIEVTNSRTGQKTWMHPETAKRRERQSEMDSTVVTINMNRENVQAETRDTQAVLTQINDMFSSIYEREAALRDKIAESYRKL